MGIGNGGSAGRKPCILSGDSGIDYFRIADSSVCIYIVVRAYFPRNKEYPAGYYDHVQDPNWYMKGPLIILTVASLVLAFTPGPLMEALQRVVMHLN